MSYFTPIWEYTKESCGGTSKLSGILVQLHDVKILYLINVGPWSIITGRTYNYNVLCGDTLRYGEYVQTNKKIDNNMKEMTVSAIILRPTRNTHGRFFYYSLATCRRLRRRRCTHIQMPHEVKDRVHAIAGKQNVTKRFTYTRCDGSNSETYQTISRLTKTTQ